jgi:CRISPR-associated protein Cmr3
MFKFLIVIRPLGLLYGSAGAFLSPENLVGRSGSKFPPDAGTLSGLILATNQEQKFTDHEELKTNLSVAGAFWAESDHPENFFVPIPRSRIVGEKNKDFDEWALTNNKWERQHPDLDPEYQWQSINSWHKQTPQLKRPEKGKLNDVGKTPWEFMPILHPYLKDDEKHVRDRDGLFLENAVQMREDSCLVYLSTHKLPDGWYRFGGENHIVEITSQALTEHSSILKLLKQKIGRSFALIAPAVWGSNNLSTRYPNDVRFSNKRPEMLTDRPEPWRYRVGKGEAQNKRASKLSIGRYAVPAGTVYVVKHPLDLTWWDFPPEWFASGEGLPLRQFGCGLCLPVEIKIEPKVEPRVDQKIKQKGED